MKSCVFFGHRNENYEIYSPLLKIIIRELIEEYNVTQFYTGGRGKFDRLCAKLIAELKNDHPNIKNTLFYSYIPRKKEDDVFAASYYDESVYFLEKPVPYKFAISETNKIAIQKSDVVIVAVSKSWGGAYNAYKYSLGKNKMVLNIFDYFTPGNVIKLKHYDTAHTQCLLDMISGWWKIQKFIIEQRKNENAEKN